MPTEKEPQLKFDWRSITPEDSPKTPMDTMNDPALRDLATPKLSVGDPAFTEKQFFEIGHYYQVLKVSVGNLSHNTSEISGR